MNLSDLKVGQLVNHSTPAVPASGGGSVIYYRNGRVLHVGPDFILVGDPDTRTVQYVFPGEIVEIRSETAEEVPTLRPGVEVEVELWSNGIHRFTGVVLQVYDQNIDVRFHSKGGVFRAPKEHITKIGGVSVNGVGQ